MSVGKDIVTAAQSAAKSMVAMHALASGQLSLTEAAALTEFIVMWTYTGRPPRGRPRLVGVASDASRDATANRLRTRRDA